MKIVINTEFGGYGLSEQAMLNYCALKGISVWIERNTEYDMNVYWTVPREERLKEIEEEAWFKMSLDARQAYNEKITSQRIYESDIPRNDPCLVEVVETLGDAANGRYASLKVVEIPDDVDWEIAEYDGSEWVAEKHRTWS